jgi:hypothetical protein
MGRLTLSLGPARVEGCFLEHRATIPSKRVFWRACSFTPIHSLTSPVGQLFVSRPGGQRFASWGCLASVSFLHLYTSHLLLVLCMCLLCCMSKKKKNRSSPLQVKSKPRDGESEHAFNIGSMDCMVANTS